MNYEKNEIQLLRRVRNLTQFILYCYLYLIFIDLIRASFSCDWLCPHFITCSLLLLPTIDIQRLGGPLLCARQIQAVCLGLVQTGLPLSPTLRNLRCYLLAPPRIPK